MTGGLTFASSAQSSTVIQTSQRFIRRKVWGSTIMRPSK